MPLESFNLINDQGQLSVSELKRLARETEAQDRFVGTDTLLVQRNAAGFQIQDVTPGDMWLQVGVHGAGNAYAWKQVWDNGAGGFNVTNTEGDKGSATVRPAYEINGNTAVPVGKFVPYTYSADGLSVLFDYRCTT